MKISIITITKNSENTIEETINSVKSQTYPNIEYIIVDGASDDNTLKIINSNRDIITTLISENDFGIYDAMNKGLSLATGDIIGILNSDDTYFSPNTVERVVQAFKANNTDSIYSNLCYVDEHKHIIRYWKAGVLKKTSFQFGWMPPHPTFWVKKSIYEKHGRFNTDFRFSADYELMLRLLHKEKISWHYLNELTVKMRIGGVSNASIKNRLIANSEDIKAWKINHLKPIWLLTRIAKPIRKITQFKIWRKKRLSTT